MGVKLDDFKTSAWWEATHMVFSFLFHIFHIIFACITFFQDEDQRGDQTKMTHPKIPPLSKLHQQRSHDLERIQEGGGFTLVAEHHKTVEQTSRYPIRTVSLDQTGKRRTNIGDLSNRTTNVHQTSQAARQHHVGRQIQKIGQRKVNGCGDMNRYLIPSMAGTKWSTKTKSRHRCGNQLRMTSWSLINTFPEDDTRTNEQNHKEVKKTLPGAVLPTL